MDVATGNGAEANNQGWWAVESALPPSHTNSAAREADLSDPSARLIQEYRVLARVAANMSSGFLLLNQREHVTYFNASAVRLLGIQSSELIEQPAFDVRKRLLALAAAPQHIQNELDHAWFSSDEEATLDMALADAAIRWLRVRCFPLRDVLGLLLGRGVLLDDITLEHSSIETRSETLAQAAHQLKTPLAVIKGCATTLLGSSTRWDPVVQREMLQMIDTQADRLYDVLNTLLDVWRLDSGAQTLRLGQVYLSELLRQLVERWQKLAPRHIFVLDIPTVMPSVLCDAVRLEQALNSLLNNAVTYSPNGGTVIIRLESNDIEVRLSITDEGIGIAPEHLDRIFTRFYRIQPASDQAQAVGEYGSGLGLTIARATFEAHGGKIWADSPGPEQGATFYCTLPLTPRLASTAVTPFTPTQPSASPVTAITGPLSMSPTQRITGALKQSQHSSVLIAESDPRLTRYLRANLEEHHYRVSTVNHGLQFLRQFDLEEPDVIMLSTTLPDMSGVELLQRLREFSHTSVIMLCNECDEDERVHLFDLGA